MTPFTDIVIHPLASSNQEERYLLSYRNQYYEASFPVVELLLELQQKPTREEAVSAYINKKGGKYTTEQVEQIIEKYVMPLFFTQTLKGRIIGTPGCFQQDGSHEYTKAFDGDPYTSFDYLYPDNGWTGIDLGTPHSINKIVYVPRNRDNFIRKGDNYELLYWENKQWNSAGCKKADSDSLLYNVPKGSLLHLINHTRGHDERIFEYKDGKQRFW